MLSKDLVIHCFAQENNGVWEAFSIEFGLAARGNTFHDARNNLDEQIREYIVDALVGDDKEYARQLLSRKAPLSLRMKYYRIKLQNRIYSTLKSLGAMPGQVRKYKRSHPSRFFDGPLPLVPQTSC